MKLSEEKQVVVIYTFFEEMFFFAFKVAGFLIGAWIAFYIITYAIVDTIVYYQSVICQL